MAYLYQIQVLGQLGPQWSQWFDGLTITTSEAASVIHGPLPDQAALFGVLSRIRDLGLTLVALQRLEPLDTADLALAD